MKVRSKRDESESSRAEREETNHSVDVPSVDSLDHSNLSLGS